MPRSTGRRSRGNAGVGRVQVPSRVVGPSEATSERLSHIESKQQSQSSRTALLSSDCQSSHASTTASNRRSLRAVTLALDSRTIQNNLSNADIVLSVSVNSATARRVEQETRAAFK